MTFEQLTTSELDLQLNSNDSSIRFTTARRQQAVNDGVREFASLTKCYIRVASIPVSCNTAEYVLSTLASFAQISDEGLVEYHHTSSGGSSIARFTQLAGDEFPRRDELWLNRAQPGWRQSTTPVSFPQAYYVRRDGGRRLLGLSEPPKVGSSQTVRLRVPYVARPPVMSASTELPFTDTSGTREDLTDYHQAFVHFAAYKLLPLMGDVQGSQAQLQTFLGYVGRHNGDETPKGGQHVTLATNYFRGMRSGGDPSLDRDPRWRWVPRG